MPTPAKLPTRPTAGSPGHLAHTGTVHAAINSLTTIRHSTRTGNYVLRLADSGEVVEFSATSPVSVTVPAEATVNFPVGTLILICQYGVAPVTVGAASGVTLRTPASLTTRTRYSEVSLRKRASNEWIVSGDLA